MILYIDTTKNDEVIIRLMKNGKNISENIFNAQYQQAEKLLPAIDKMIRKNSYL